MDWIEPSSMSSEFFVAASEAAETFFNLISVSAFRLHPSRLVKCSAIPQSPQFFRGGVGDDLLLRYVVKISSDCVVFTFAAVFLLAPLLPCFSGIDGASGDTTGGVLDTVVAVHDAVASFPAPSDLNLSTSVAAGDVGVNVPSV